jgi:hypothetical protein
MSDGWQGDSGEGGAPGSPARVDGGADARGCLGLPWKENPGMSRCTERPAVWLIQTGKGQWHQLGKVFGEEDQGAFAEHVLDGVDAAIVGKGHTQQALVAGVAQFVGEQEGKVEGRQLVAVLLFRSWAERVIFY